MKQIDCRGLACPQPVITTKKALGEMAQGQLTVIADNPSARDNVERFAQSQGAIVNIEKKGNDFYLHIEKKSACDLVASTQIVEKVVVYINSDVLGVGEEALGATLIRSFLHVLSEMETKPSTIIFINSGVRLATEGSVVLEDLQSLSEKGAAILSCGTCLDFYGIKEKLRVGIISNMYDIAKSLFEADRLIRP
ncbi:MAG: sulfurtransferase-like selenium metabolism protein YedF [Deltaproteobacteria bacterium]|nr:sulfurtransferase-like selenium metabolism protein YedF [Deltaproteobacteria bacterium]